MRCKECKTEMITERETISRRGYYIFGVCPKCKSRCDREYRVRGSGSNRIETLVHEDWNEEKLSQGERGR